VFEREESENVEESENDKESEEKKELEFEDENEIESEDEREMNADDEENDKESENNKEYENEMTKFIKKEMNVDDEENYEENYVSDVRGNFIIHKKGCMCCKRMINAVSEYTSTVTGETYKIDEYYTCETNNFFIFSYMWNS